jgi:serine/threonine-protein kinase
MAADTDATRALGAPVRDPGAQLPAGSVVGDWCVVRHLATGGFGTVYEVVHRGGGPRGALKVLHSHLLASPEIVARLVREAQVIARLRHRNVVELLDAAVDAEGHPYLVMEYLEGRDLAALLDETGRVTPARALAVLAPLCAAVARAHELGVIHRDVKASNVFLCDEDGEPRVVLLDFGIAKLLDVGAAELTASRQALGTPASMAPEQIRGGEVDVRTDVYALGALAYHLLTGRMPFEDVSVTMSQYLHLHAARPRPSAVAPVGAELDEVVMKAMAVDPARRYVDALSFLAALRTAVLGAHDHDARTVDAIAARVGVLAPDGELDDAALDDIAAVLALAETELAASGFSYVRDLGDASLFIATTLDEERALAVARAADATLANRSGADPRVAVTIWLHAGPATIVGGQLSGGELDDPSSWGVPQDAVGIWVTGALAAANGAAPRRLS